MMIAIPTSVRSARRVLSVIALCASAAAWCADGASGNVASTYTEAFGGSAPCCGEITPSGERLLHMLDGANVEHLWLVHEHVNWETGEPDRGPDYAGPGRKTHCSAFAASIAERLGVYLLRPPEHSQILLASAQAEWLDSDSGRVDGWRALADARTAQQFANRGELVLIVYRSPDPHKPGHIAIVRPSLKSQALLDAEGPEITQAGATNHTDWYARAGFQGHRGAWPDAVKYFVHAMPTP